MNTSSMKVQSDDDTKSEETPTGRATDAVSQATCCLVYGGLNALLIFSFQEREHFEQYESQLGPFDKSPLNEPEGLGGESGDEEAEEEDTSTNMNITGQSSVIITSEDSIQIGTIDVEGTDEEDIEKGRKGEGLIASSLLPVTGGGMDILSHDLQYSSSSSSEGEGEEEDITDMEEV
ncbi:PREDICTED: uncharacterized protein LOC109586284 [Amphimedon queenslandica]|uniref:Uncharacterized protein n=1 Tax=Amphimedon queenslandica TaxID=400682 RepID=A0AAN0JML5_AMPQE|nr:PREDICTED: uncharacterized protein LOC109586284 [Amphimedon queenslandica]|eukprot:XP_019858019.1 PREDICTED: uncharacterized protein LOC109586284 [Amphimedon queenslandica]